MVGVVKNFFLANRRLRTREQSNGFRSLGASPLVGNSSRALLCFWSCKSRSFGKGDAWKVLCRHATPPPRCVTTNPASTTAEPSLLLHFFTPPALPPSLVRPHSAPTPHNICSMAVGPEEGKSGFAAGRGRPIVVEPPPAGGGGVGTGSGDVLRRPRGSSMGGADSKVFVPSPAVVAAVEAAATSPQQFEDAD